MDSKAQRKKEAERRKTIEQARNKSAPKRRANRHQEVLKSLPNQTVMNRLVTRDKSKERGARLNEWLDD